MKKPSMNIGWLFLLMPLAILAFFGLLFVGIRGFQLVCEIANSIAGGPSRLVGGIVATVGVTVPGIFVLRYMFCEKKPTICYVKEKVVVVDTPKTGRKGE